MPEIILAREVQHYPPFRNRVIPCQLNQFLQKLPGVRLQYCPNTLVSIMGACKILGCKVNTFGDTAFQTFCFVLRFCPRD